MSHVSTFITQQIKRVRIKEEVKTDGSARTFEPIVEEICSALPIAGGSDEDVENTVTAPQYIVNKLKAHCSAAKSKQRRNVGADR